MDSHFTIGKFLSIYIHIYIYDRFPTEKTEVFPWSNLLWRMLKRFLQDLRGMFVVAQLAARQQDIAQLSSLRFGAKVEDLLPFGCRLGGMHQHDLG